MADSTAILCQRHKSNTPAILTPTSGDTIIAANEGRAGFIIQNLGTNPLFIRLGTGATTLLFHEVLKASTGDSDGSGGIFEMKSGTIYTGAVSVAGTNPKLVITEL